MKKWKNLPKRGFALLITLLMCVSLLPITANAALLTGEQFSIRVNVGYIENGQFHLTGSTMAIGTCQDGTGHSGYNHTMSADDIANSVGYSGQIYVSKTTYWSGENLSHTRVTYNITGRAPYKADQVIWVVGSKPAVDTGTSGGDYTDPGGYTGDTRNPGNKEVKLRVQVVYHNSDGTTKNGPSGYAILPCNGGHSSAGHNYSCNPTVANALAVAGNLHQKRGQPDVYTQYIGWKCGYYQSTLTTTKTSLGRGNYSDRSPIEVHYQAPPLPKYTFAMTYNANGGKVEQQSSYTVSVETTDKSYKFNSLEPIWEGHEFLGWYTAATGGTKISWPQELNTTTKTKTVYAHWQLIPDDHEDATVIYLPGSNGNGYKTETIPGSKEYTILSPTSAGITGPTGKVFSHWEYQNTSKDKYFGGDRFTPADGSSNIFVAIWKADDSQTGNAVYTVSWYDQDGKSIQNTVTRRARLNSPVSVTEEDKIVQGYTFDPTNSKNLENAILTVTSGTALKLYFTKNLDPVLEISKKANTSVQEGGVLEYTITVTNKGQAAATNVVVSDTLPAELLYTSATPGYSNSSSTTENGTTLYTYSWNLGTIKVGETKENIHQYHGQRDRKN